MLKIKTILNALQVNGKLSLNVDGSESIMKYAPNQYMINSDYFSNGFAMVGVEDLKAFIRDNQQVFIDMFGTDQKFKGLQAVKSSLDETLEDRFSGETLEDARVNAKLEEIAREMRKLEGYADKVADDILKELL